MKNAEMSDEIIQILSQNNSNSMEKIKFYNCKHISDEKLINI